MYSVILDKLKDFNGINVVKADISNAFVDALNNTSNVVLFVAVNKTNSEMYKQTKQIIKDMNKNVLTEVLV